MCDFALSQALESSTAGENAFERNTSKFMDMQDMQEELSVDAGLDLQSTRPNPEDVSTIKMCGFDLSQALESPPESGENVFERNAGMCTDIPEETLTVDMGLDLVVNIHPIRFSMRGVATLVMAVNRMKSFGNATSPDETDGNIVRTCADGLTSSSEKEYRRRKSSVECTLCDTNHKNLVRTTSNQLVAKTLQGGKAGQREKLKLARYRPPPNSTEFSLVVFSAVCNNTRHHFSCSWQADRPVFKLEASETKLGNLTGDMDRFVFNMKTEGKDLTTFESVKYKGWFISTSQEEGQHLKMCKKNNTSREIYFKMTLPTNEAE